MKRKIIYLTHWRFPSEKTMTPLIMKTCEGFIWEGYDTELWIPKRHNPKFKGVDPFKRHHIQTRYPIRRIFAIDLMRFLGKFGFLLMLVSFNLAAFCKLLFGNRQSVVLYAHDERDILFLSWLGYPTYIEIHDFYESNLGWINRLVFSRASGLIVTNRIKIKHLNENYGVPMNSMLHQPNAVDYDFFQTDLTKDKARKELGLPSDKRIILYTGHLFSWKGVDTLALAAAYLPEDSVVYFVGGTPEDRDVLKNFIREHSLPHIEFLPHQDHARIPRFLKAADVLVLPNTAKEDASKYETSPVKLFEYMSSGTPIVASDLPSIRDIVNDDEVRFFTADNPRSLAQVVTDTLRDAKTARVRAEKAGRHAKELSWEARASHIARLMARTEGKLQGN